MKKYWFSRYPGKVGHVTEVTPTPSDPCLDCAPTWQGSCDLWRTSLWAADRWCSTPWILDAAAWTASSNDIPSWTTNKVHLRHRWSSLWCNCRSTPRGRQQMTARVPTTLVPFARALPGLHSVSTACSSCAGSTDQTEDANRFLPPRCSTALRAEKILGSLRNDDADCKRRLVPLGVRQGRDPESPSCTRGRSGSLFHDSACPLRASRRKTRLIGSMFCRGTSKAWKGGVKPKGLNLLQVTSQPRRNGSHRAPQGADPLGFYTSSPCCPEPGPCGATTRERRPSAFVDPGKFVNHPDRRHRLYIVQEHHCAVLVNKNTFDGEIRTIPTRRKGYSEWALKGMVVGERLGRPVHHGSDYFVVLSVHVNNRCAERKSRRLNLLLLFRGL